MNPKQPQFTAEDREKITKAMMDLASLQEHPGYAVLMGYVDGLFQSADSVVTTSLDQVAIVRSSGILAVTRAIKNFVPQNIAAFQQQLKKEA